MFDHAHASHAIERVKGRAGAVIGPEGRLSRLWQGGSAKAILPRMHGRAAEVVFLNTAGGLTGGDRLEYGLSLAAGARAVGTTQTAERAYLSRTGAARVDVDLSVGAGATLHWLPQELILFEGAAMDRRLRVEMAEDAAFLMLETLVLGRAAMGERLCHIDLRDRREVIRGGRPAMVEAIRLTDADLVRSGAAGLNGSVALATLALFAPDAEDRVARLRAVLPGGGAVRAAVSAWDGKLVVRFMAPEAWPLRQAVARAVACLTGGMLPRVWQI